MLFSLMLLEGAGGAIGGGGGGGGGGGADTGTAAVTGGGVSCEGGSGLVILGTAYSDDCFWFSPS